MKRVSGVLMLVWIWAGAACAGPTAPPPPVAAVEPEAPVETTQTGVLSEEEFKQLHELTGDKAPAPKGENIELAGSTAYLSLPEGAPSGGIVVIHEWWGLNEHIKHWTDRLAADGYAALAVDLYGGKVGTTPDEAMALIKSVDEAKAKEILDAAHAFLATDQRVAAKKRAVIGWCFGGGWSLAHAIATPDLDAAVIYYGRLETDPKALAPIGADVLGIFANQDKGIPPEAVDAFEKAMNAAGKTLTVHRYDANHAFANPSSAVYDPPAATQAWSETSRFLAEHLRAP